MAVVAEIAMGKWFILYIKTEIVFIAYMGL